MVRKYASLSSETLRDRHRSRNVRNDGISRKKYLKTTMINLIKNVKKARTPMR